MIYEYKWWGELRNHSLVITGLVTTSYSKQNKTACTNQLRLYFRLLHLLWHLRWIILKFIIPCIMIQLLQCKPTNPHTSLELQQFFNNSTPGVFREIAVTHLCIYNPCFCYYKKIFSVHLSYCVFVLDSTDISFYRNTTRQIMLYCWSIQKLYCVPNKPDAK
jgi:hypothetical protein